LAKKKNDFSHINMAELDTGLKGINMDHNWGITNLTVISYSATVCTWLNSVISGDRKIRIHGISEALVMRRLGIVRELVADGKLRIQPQLVKSAENKEDILTIVCMKWLKRPTVCSALSVSEDQERHNKHHFGFKKTKYFVQAENEETPDSVIKGVINDCPQCKSIDPAPIRWESGSLACANNWERMAMDVTHFNRALYLTMIDCSPSRFAIWRKLKLEEAKQVQ